MFYDYNMEWQQDHLHALYFILGIEVFFLYIAECFKVINLHKIS